MLAAHRGLLVDLGFARASRSAQAASQAAQVAALAGARRPAPG
jgi:hypothetical protein